MIACWLALCMWFLGTNYQRVFTHGALLVMRAIGILLLVVVTPLAVAYGYSHQLAMTSYVGGEFTDVMRKVLEGSLVVSSTARINELYGQMRQQMTLQGFLTSMVSSAGAIIIILQTVILLAARRTRTMFLASRDSRYGRFFYAFLGLPGEGRQPGVSDHS